MDHASDIAAATDLSRRCAERQHHGGRERVHLSQSATSAALNELERTLSARLFDRVGKRLILNDSGRDLLSMALAVLDGAESIETTFVPVIRRCPST